MFGDRCCVFWTTGPSLSIGAQPGPEQGPTEYSVLGTSCWNKGPPKAAASSLVTFCAATLLDLKQKRHQQWRSQPIQWLSVTSSG